MAATEELQNTKVRERASPPGRRWGEVIIERLIQVAGISAIVIIALIFFFLLREGLPMFLDIPLRQLFGIAGIRSRTASAWCRCSSARCW